MREVNRHHRREVLNTLFQEIVKVATSMDDTTDLEFEVAIACHRAIKEQAKLYEFQRGMKVVIDYQ